jgi:CheY-like chemotaxis protein
MKDSILIVDDERLVLKTLSRVLSREDYLVHCATSGKHVFEIIEHEEVRVFFLDLKMPEMNGLDLCREIKRLKPVSFVYALTGYAEDYEIRQCREAGFDDYFLKPFKVDMILKAAAEAFEKLRRWERPDNEK